MATFDYERRRTDRKQAPDELTTQGRLKSADEWIVIVIICLIVFVVAVLGCLKLFPIPQWAPAGASWVCVL
jgi:hypothetical protein